MGLRQGLEIWIFSGPPSEAGAATPSGDTLLLGCALLPVASLCLAPCQAGPGTSAERASSPRYAISSPENNTLF